MGEKENKLTTIKDDVIKTKALNETPVSLKLCLLFKMKMKIQMKNKGSVLCILEYQGTPSPEAYSRNPSSVQLFSTSAIRPPIRLANDVDNIRKIDEKQKEAMSNILICLV